MNSCWPSRKRWYSAGIGSLTLTIRSAPAKTSSAGPTSVAPAAAYSSSVNREPAPAPACTSTRWPSCTSSATPSGVSATRFSLSLISLGDSDDEWHGCSFGRGVADAPAVMGTIMPALLRRGRGGLGGPVGR